MHRLRPAVTAVAIALLLVTSLDHLAFATTGRSLLLGQRNVDDTTTSVRNTGSGPAMAFRVRRKSTAPFAVNASGRVDRLNADRVDGLDSTDLAPTAVGVIDSSGDLLRGRGVASVSVDPTNKQYLITLKGGISYLSDRFTTVVTTTCAGVVARTTSSSGSLVVTLQDSDRLPALCQFGFVTYAL